jgi:hypothetical protein
MRSGAPQIDMGGGKRKCEDTHAKMPMGNESPRPGAAERVAHAHAYPPGLRSKQPYCAKHFLFP